MDRSISPTTRILLVLISLSLFLNVSVAAVGGNSHHKFLTEKNLLTPRQYLLRYWSSRIKNGLPEPAFLLSKASPLTASQHAYLTKLANHNALAPNYASFCTMANLFCLPDPRAQTFPQGNNETIYTPSIIGSPSNNANTNGTATNNPSSNGTATNNKGSGRVNNSNGMQFANYNMQFSHYEINKNNTGSSFTNYSDETNFGLAVFKDYSKEGSAGSVTFANYTQGASFNQYSNASGQQPEQPDSLRPQGTTSSVTRSSLVEPGKFFREAQLKKGNVMPMPDIRDKMPRRSFLPKSVVSRLPFSSSRMKELKEIFHAADKSTMEWVINNALVECERKPSPGETKKCVGSIEDMVDFATSVLGHNVVVRTTNNVNGSSKNVMIGSVKAVNGGKVTKAVSCHQSLYPYMLYYCHSVPNVRVYEADILDENTKKKINHGVAICHLDTSTWSPLHAAFVALGNGPGKIEVCHWIFENDMIWTWAT